MGSEVMGLLLPLFLSRHTHTHTRTHAHTHTLCSGLLGPREMSVCGLIQPPVPVLMMASTCCFNVTAGSPSIPHWLWLPSAAGSSPRTLLPPSPLPSQLPPSTLTSIYSDHSSQQCPFPVYFSTVSYFHPLPAKPPSLLFSTIVSILQSSSSTVKALPLLNPILIWGERPKSHLDLWEMQSNVETEAKGNATYI